jgi:hypothetical protein
VVFLPFSIYWKWLSCVGEPRWGVVDDANAGIAALAAGLGRCEYVDLHPALEAHSTRVVEPFCTYPLFYTSNYMGNRYGVSKWKRGKVQTDPAALTQVAPGEPNPALYRPDGLHYHQAG